LAEWYGVTSVPYRRILVPIHGSPDDMHILELAGTLAERRNAEVTLVYVVEVKQALRLDTPLPDVVAAGEAALQRAEAYARGKAEHKLQRLTLELIQARNIGAAIVDEAIAREANLIVMACRNRMHLGRLTVGETVPYVLKNAPCEVIVSRLEEE
jgi:nucleotide-binding universal stress UspA family protein